MFEAGRRVRVCDYDRVYGFREESPDISRDQDAGRLFFGSFLWSEQRNERESFLNLVDTGFRRYDSRRMRMVWRLPRPYGLAMTTGATYSHCEER